MNTIPKLGLNILGAVDDMPSPSDIGTSLGGDLDRISALGVRLVRAFFNEWKWSQPTPDNGGHGDGNSMTRWDTWMRECENRGLWVLPILGSLDRDRGVWRPPGLPYPGATSPALSVANWQTFVSKFVQRYQPGGGFALVNPVQVWQIWNEPNFVDNQTTGTSSNWGGRKPSPQEYAIYALNTARDRIQQAGRDANLAQASWGRVLTAGLADQDRFAQGADWVGWIWDAGGRFDVACVHPYWQPSDTILSAQAAYSKLQQRGVTRQVWVTEFGWSADATNTSGVRYRDRYNGEDIPGLTSRVQQYCTSQQDAHNSWGFGPSLFYPVRGSSGALNDPLRDKWCGPDGGFYDYAGTERNQWGYTPGSTYAGWATRAPVYYALPTPS